jgi:Resolvase, N terminal domain
MNGSTKIQPTHLKRQAVVHLRQSTPQQVLKNRESALNQRSLRDRLYGLGWRKDQILLIDEEEGLAGRQAIGREGFQGLVADVSLRKVGIIMGYEVSRVSRKCADWHPLLELCALFDTLIGDADGIYNPRDFNDRLLLGVNNPGGSEGLDSPPCLILEVPRRRVGDRQWRLEADPKRVALEGHQEGPARQSDPMGC